MPVNKKNLGLGCLTLNAQVRRNINEVLRTGRLSYGPFSKEFERRFSRSHETKGGVMVNSGTSALQIAVACLAETGKWKPGDEVIVPAVTFVASSNVVLQQGFKPVFVDVDPRTYNIDPSKIKAKITRRTRAIMVVHLFGQPTDMDPVMRLARKHNLRVIEDSCETMFTSYHGRSVGSIGDIGCFSTYMAHLIVTGVGGIAVTNNGRYETILRSLANHGRDGIYTSLDDAKGKTWKQTKQVIARRFRFIRNGYSYRVTELESALGCAQLDMAPWIFAQRKKNSSYLLKHLKPLDSAIQLPWHPKGVGHAFMMFPLVIKPGSGIRKQALINELERHGIETRDMLPLVNQPFYKKQHKVRESDYPVAKWINHNGFYIGCHQAMGKPELDFIIKILTRSVRTLQKKSR